LSESSSGKSRAWVGRGNILFQHIGKLAAAGAADGAAVKSCAAAMRLLYDTAGDWMVVGRSMTAALSGRAAHRQVRLLSEDEKDKNRPRLDVIIMQKITILSAWSYCSFSNVLLSVIGSVLFFV